MKNLLVILFSISNVTFAAKECVSDMWDISSELGIRNALVCIDGEPRSAGFYEARVQCHKERKKLCTIEQLMAATAYPEQVKWRGEEWLDYRVGNHDLTFNYDAKARKAAIERLIFGGSLKYRCCYTD